MTADEKRIAIAEACGWKYIEKSDLWINQNRLVHGDKKQSTHLPDYFGDLNAALKLVDALSKKGWSIEMTKCGQKWGVRLDRFVIVRVVEKIAVRESLCEAICEAYAVVEGLWK